MATLVTIHLNLSSVSSLGPYHLSDGGVDTERHHLLEPLHQRGLSLPGHRPQQVRQGDAGSQHTGPGQ